MLGLQLAEGIALKRFSGPCDGSSICLSKYILQIKVTHLLFRIPKSYKTDGHDVYDKLNMYSDDEFGGRYAAHIISGG